MGEKTALVKKSLRLPQDLVDYVETQPGADFSKKLVGILNEYREGDEVRRKNIAAYDATIAEKRATLRKIFVNISRFSVLDRYVEKMLQEFDALGSK